MMHRQHKYPLFSTVFACKGSLKVAAAGVELDQLAPEKLGGDVGFASFVSLPNFSHRAGSTSLKLPHLSGGCPKRKTCGKYQANDTCQHGPYNYCGRYRELSKPRRLEAAIVG